MHTFICRVASITFSLLLAVGTTRAGDVYVQTNLVTNNPSLVTGAPITDTNLQGAWGLSFSKTSPFWISDQDANVKGSGATTVYRVSTTQPPSSSPPVLTVGIPNQRNAPPSGPAMTNGPTGQVNTTAPFITTVSGDFPVPVGGSKAAFIFANLDGSISGWNGGATSTIMATVPGASFTGLAIGNLPGPVGGPVGAAQLYAADQNSGNIDVINNKWQMTGSLIDPNFANFPTGYAAFNVQNLNVNGTQTLFVTYANQSTSGGIVDEFSTNGTFIKTLISDTAGAHLNSPWGLAIAPQGWGQFGGDLLVGNNNAGPDSLTEINAYSLSGAWQGTLTLNTGQPFSATELWALSFGNGVGAGSTDTLFFTAGLDNNANGLFGAISSVPEPSSAVLGLIAMGVLAGGWRWKNRRRTGRS